MKLTRGLVLLPLLALAGTTLAARPRNDRASELAKKIDAALNQEWQREGITPAEPTTDLELLRRMTLDLLGTIPSLEEIRAFEGEPDSMRREALPARLLADPRFQAALAERLARITVGPGRKPDDLFYRRRRYVEWLRDQVAKHRPWDELVREIVAAEGITVDGPTNFVAAFDGDPVRLAGRTARAFLGIRLDCAQCHDHPFASWKQADFEGLAAFFARTRRQGPLVRELTSGDYEIEDRKEGRVRLVGPEVPFAREVLTRTGKRRDALGRWLTDGKNPLFARSIANRIWAWLMGRGFIEPTDSIDEGKARYPAVLALLEDELRANRFDLEELIRAIVSTRAYALSSRGPDALVGSFAVADLKPLHADQLANTLWQATSFTTEDDDRILPVRLARLDQTGKFVARHGADPDAEVPEDETLLERLLLMNGQLVHERIKNDNPFGATGRLLFLAPSDEKLVETAFLMTLTRRPTPAETERFVARLETDRKHAAEDLLWALLNSSELAWNH